ncbi:hypothetical protein ACKKBG_A09415 [Auxenochlorella protothecoides x Auxenochlorella symbiontica]
MALSRAMRPEVQLASPSCRNAGMDGGHSSGCMHRDAFLRASTSSAAPAHARRPTVPSLSRPSRCHAMACRALPPAHVAQQSMPSTHPLLGTRWFQDAVRDVAKHVSEGLPFMELVQLHGPCSGKAPHFSSFKVEDDVVSAPQLWRSIAECLSGEDPDVVMLCKRVDSAADVGGQASPSSDTVTEVKQACRALVRSGIAHAVMRGRVGDCCEEDSPWDDRGAGPGFWSRHHHRPHGKAARVGQAQEVNFWGLVVQSRAHTGAEGCYLLKTVRNVEPATDCSCTHYSLTRICQGEGLEGQFVKSWLARS